MLHVLIEDHVLIHHNNNYKMSNLTTMKLQELTLELVEQIMFVTMIYQYLQQVQPELFEKR